jgi:16S rRNA (uracil1498-N3)-methyltransferase
MRIIRIYQPGEYHTGQSIELSSEAVQHVSVVLRMREGELLTLFAGNNKEFTATITSIHKKKVILAIGEECVVNRESSLKIHLAQSISKGERMEFVVQKAVELGVTSITPLITERCVVKLDKTRMEKKLAQWRAITIAACEQSGRNQLPIINATLSLADYLQKNQAALQLVLDPYIPKTWRDYTLTEHRNIAVLIGPEGGFSETEKQAILAADFLPLSLGPRILRTETAAIATISVLQAIGGDL